MGLAQAQQDLQAFDRRWLEKCGGERLVLGRRSFDETSGDGYAAASVAFVWVQCAWFC
jgi:hypothetical protein